MRMLTRELNHINMFNSMHALNSEDISLHNTNRCSSFIWTSGHLRRARLHLGYLGAHRVI